ncbi:virulence RhuM family protein [Anaerococcus sp. NML200574]|uniref:virulence RhuM family protein n=1 Tax=Anaerococcus sp. NML200574 TaxID=2954486 RepID=UPI0022388106|nr:virulence RhuM family protein [Anaerococcus sp. NML200574]MCW6679262.1 virulence RhuM family protein [Anaerococcus sp. NML200574]
MTVQNEGAREAEKEISYYSLEMILAIGYRVRSVRGVQFRKYSTTVLKEYILKGFALDDDMLKAAGGGNYFKELLARIRDIRSSEKVFYLQVLDLFSTSIDYDKNSQEAKRFFATVQNEMICKFSYWKLIFMLNFNGKVINRLICPNISLR